MPNTYQIGQSCQVPFSAFFLWGVDRLDVSAPVAPYPPPPLAPYLLLQITCVLSVRFKRTFQFPTCFIAGQRRPSPGVGPPAIPWRCLGFLARGEKCLDVPWIAWVELI
jgi:hypothetical protein